MENRIARVISFVFHPLLIPGYLLVVLLVTDPTFTILLPVKITMLIIGIVLGTTLVFPLIVIVILYRLKIVTSFYLPQREERIFPLIAMAIFYYLTFYLIRDIYLPRNFQLFMLGATLLAVITLIVNLFLRVSMHMIALGALSGLFMGMTFAAGGPAIYLLQGTILVSGLTGSARLKLNTHQPLEIYAGWLIGASGMCLTSLLI